MVPSNKKVKIRPKTVDCIFISYAQNNSVYWFLVYGSKVSDVHKNTIIESRNALFVEHVFPCNSRVESKELQQLHEIIIENNQNEENDKVQEQ